MKRFLVLLAATAMFSCMEENYTIQSMLNDGGKRNGDGSMTINVNVYNRNDYPKNYTVKADVHYWGQQDQETYKIYYPYIAKTRWNGGNFKITLPAEVEDSLLMNLNNILGTSEFMSDPYAKALDIRNFYLYNNKDNRVIELAEGQWNKVEYVVGVSLGSYRYNYDDLKLENLYVYWIYTDRDVTIKGSYESQFYGSSSYDLDFKRGWNIMYYQLVRNLIPLNDGTYAIYGGASKQTFTSKKPKLPLKWQM